MEGGWIAHPSGCTLASCSAVAGSCAAQGTQTQRSRGMLRSASFGVLGDVEWGMRTYKGRAGNEEVDVRFIVEVHSEQDCRCQDPRRPQRQNRKESVLRVGP